MEENRKPSHFCALVVMRLPDAMECLAADAGATVECLVIDYRKAGGSIQVKWAGGNNNEKETPFVDMVSTLRREVLDELGVEICLSDKALSGRTIFNKEASLDHKKYFFFVSGDEIVGKLRKTLYNDDGDEVLSPPYWKEAEALAREIFLSHRPALINALKFICRNFEQTRAKYSRLLKTA